MDLLDNNILINAFRPDLDHHAVAHGWLEEALNDGSALRLFPTVEAGFMRVVTHPKIFDPPSTRKEASAFLRVMCAAPTVEIVPWSAACRARWLRLCLDLALAGNDCNDAMLAAVALEKGLRMATFDEGFRRFPKLKLEILRG